MLLNKTKIIRTFWRSACPWLSPGFAVTVGAATCPCWFFMKSKQSFSNSSLRVYLSSVHDKSSTACVSKHN